MYTSTRAQEQSNFLSPLRGVAYHFTTALPPQSRGSVPVCVCTRGNHIEHTPDNVEQSADVKNQLRLGICRHLSAGWKDLFDSVQLLENPKSKDSPALAASAHRIKAHRLRNHPSSCPWENKAGSFRSPSTANSGSSSPWPLMPGGFKCLHSTQMIVFMCHKGGFLQPLPPVCRSYFSLRFATKNKGLLGIAMAMAASQRAGRY